MKNIMSVEYGPIMVEASVARRYLRELCARIEAGHIPPGVHADHKYLSDCLDELDIWADRRGVFRKGEASLDFALSSREWVAEGLIKNFKNLNKNLTECMRAVVIALRSHY